MAKSINSFQFTISSVPKTVDVPTRINIKKRREVIAYNTVSSPNNINISYLIGQNTNVSNNLFINDRSTSLTQNQNPDSDILTETTSVITLSVDKFLLTDKFTTESATKPETPLFYVHTLSSYNSSLDDFSNRTLLSVNFTDKNFNNISVSEYVIDSTTGEVFNNFQNNYNESTGEYEVTHISYTVQITESGTTSTEIYSELISNDFVFKQADFDDIDSYGKIKLGRRKYIINELSGQFEVTLPTVNTYAYKETANSRIKLLKPIAQTLDDPWYIRVTNGRFLASLPRSFGGNYNSYKYSIAEFNSQSFLPFPPYKYQPNERAIWLTNNLIKVAKNIRVDSSINLHIDVYVRNSSEELKAVYTTDTNKVGSNALGTTIKFTSGILSFDKENGFIELSSKVRSDDIINVSYFSEETEYVFTSIDFNPINNLDILRQRIAIYINPESIFSGEITKSIYYLVVDENGKITYSSQATNTSLDPATVKLIQEDFNTDGTPKHDFYYDIESSQSGLDSRVSGVNSEYIDEFSFIDKYTTESVLLSSAIAPSGSSSFNFRDNPKFLLLGDVYVAENQSPDSLTTFDVRVQGGGIKQGQLSNALLDQPEVGWYFDTLSANKPVPTAGAFYAEIPKSVLKDFGGSFDKQTVKDIVNRHMKLGGYGVIDYYGIDPVITNSAVNSGQVVVYWPSYGEDISYNVYYSKKMNFGFQKFNTSELDNVASGNIFTVSGLQPSTDYYLHIGAVDENDIETKGPTVKLTTLEIN